MSQWYFLTWWSVMRVDEGAKVKHLWGRSGMAGRLGVGLIDQAVSSGTNFLLLILIARSVKLEHFGAFGIAYATYVLLLGVLRALTSEPLVIRYSAADEAERRRASEEALGATLVGSAALTLPCLAVGMLLSGSAREVVLALAICLPGLMLQDTWRFVFFANGQPGKTLVNDLVWAAGQLGFVGVLLYRGLQEVWLLVLAWGIAAGVAAIFALVQGAVRPRPLASRQWLRTEGKRGGAYVVDFLAMSGTGYLLLYGLGAVAGTLNRSRRCPVNDGADVRVALSM